jgi:SAM-dependent methyltransferase
MVYPVAVRDVEAIRAYYARILPFYEMESAASPEPPSWRDLARRWRPRRILEIGSGLGRVSASLATVAPTFGLDVSYDLLRCARRRRGRAQALFVAADARQAPFGPFFDLIVAPSDPLCHLTRGEDRRRALRNVASQLLPGGRFVLDGLYRPVRRRLDLERAIRLDGAALRIRETWRPQGRGLWRATYRYRCVRPAGISRTLVASFTARAWDPDEIRPLFSSCGLLVEAMRGDLRGSAFRRGGHRLVVFARRRNRRTSQVRIRAPQ